MEIHHETLVFERNFDAPPARLFQAYTDPRQREVWSAPTPETVIAVDETDMRTGGRETVRCGRAENLNWTMKVLYHRVTKDRQITFTEELRDGDDVPTVALVTFDLEKRGETGIRLTPTDQITSFVGEGGVAGHRDGYTKALESLSKSARRA
ncbi:MAG: SRPBCC domain-containing protein [Pseudomonadota bacterium]